MGSGGHQLNMVMRRFSDYLNCFLVTPKCSFFGAVFLGHAQIKYVGPRYAYRAYRAYTFCIERVEGTYYVLSISPTGAGGQRARSIHQTIKHNKNY